MRLPDVTRLLAAYPAAVAVLLLALPVIAPRSGPLTLVDIFSTHLALLALVLVPVAVVRRDIALRVSLLALGLVAAVRFGDEWVSVPRGVDAAEVPFRTASWNLELGARAGDDAAAELGRLDADLVALQELGPDHARSIEGSAALTARYPHRELYPDPGVMGMGLLSRWPVLRAEFRADPSVVEAVIDVDGRQLTVINAHPLAGRLGMVGPVPVAFDSADRDARLARVRTRIDDAIGRGEAVIVLGDFNVTPTEPGYLQLSAGLRDAHRDVGIGPGWTWRPSRFEWAAMGLIRIDHALSSPRLPPIAVSEDCTKPGDHCILEAWFALPSTQSTFDVQLPAVGDLVAPLPVTVDDRTGLVTSVGAVAEPRDGSLAARRHPGQPNLLVVSWLGGMCDRRVRMAVVPVGPTIRIGVRNERAPGACRLAGIHRAVVLELLQPVDPSVVTVETVP